MSKLQINRELPDLLRFPDRIFEESVLEHVFLVAINSSVSWTLVLSLRIGCGFQSLFPFLINRSFLAFINMVFQIIFLSMQAVGEEHRRTGKFAHCLIALGSQLAKGCRLLVVISSVLV